MFEHVTTADLEPLRSFLAQHSVAHLATAGDGGPHSAPVFFALVGSGASLTWTSSPGVLHSRHLETEVRASLSVAPSNPPLARIVGAQLRGRVRLPISEQPGLRAAFLDRHPDARAYLAAQPDARFYAFEPSWARLITLEAPGRRRLEWSFEG